MPSGRDKKNEQNRQNKTKRDQESGGGWNLHLGTDLPQLASVYFWVPNKK